MKMKIQRGFTVIELMIAVTLIAAMVVIAVPAFTSIVGTNESVSNSNTFLSALKLARSEATKRRLNVIVCASENQTNCTATNQWSDGWIVFQDTDGDGAFDSGETIITTYDLPAGFSVTRAASGPDQILFSATGLATSTQTFRFCRSGTSSGREFDVERSGLITGRSVDDC